MDRAPRPRSMVGRRTLTRGAGWLVPAVYVAAATPAAAASVNAASAPFSAGGSASNFLTCTDGNSHCYQDLRNGTVQFAYSTSPCSGGVQRAVGMVGTFDEVVTYDYFFTGYPGVTWDVLPTYPVGSTSCAWSNPVAATIFNGGLSNLEVTACTGAGTWAYDETTGRYTEPTYPIDVQIYRTSISGVLQSSMTQPGCTYAGDPLWLFPNYCTFTAGPKTTLSICSPTPRFRWDNPVTTNLVRGWVKATVRLVSGGPVVTLPLTGTPCLRQTFTVTGCCTTC